MPVATLLAACIAAVGVIATGVLTIVQESGREDARAKGAARVLSGELSLAGGDMYDLAIEGRLRRFGNEYPVEVEPSDLRLIYSRLSPEEWSEVETTVADIANLRRLIENRYSIDGRRPLPAPFLENIRADLEEICEAQVVLNKLGDIEGAACKQL